jgi:hypothetical protein
MSTAVTAENRLADFALFKERFALALLMYLFFCTGSAFAEEPIDDVRGGGKSPFERTPMERGHVRPGDKPAATFNALAPVNPPLSLDLDFKPREKELFGGEFRPRGKSLAAREDASPSTDFDDMPALHAAPGWQHLQDYKVRGGIQLLTIWESRLNSLAVQAGHGGSATLQWTTHPFGGSLGSTRGLFDRLFSTALSENLQHAGRSLSPTRLLHPSEKTEIAAPEH